ncbi:unnamed protein product [Closterium sp. NIES-54]
MRNAHWPLRIFLPFADAHGTSFHLPFRLSAATSAAMAALHFIASCPYKAWRTVVGSVSCFEEEATATNSDGKQQQQQQRWRLSCELLPRTASATTPCTQPDAQCAAAATPCTQPDALGAAAAAPCTQPDALGAAAAMPCTQPDALGGAAGATPCTQPDLSVLLQRAAMAG